MQDLFNGAVDPTTKTVLSVCHFCRVLFEDPCNCTELKEDMLGRIHCEETRETPICFECMCNAFGKNGGKL
tara:strand:+ start:1248 stop:1460 length:213 start_codon:yes stop_codon:yes gene_type:complete